MWSPIKTRRIEGSGCPQALQGTRRGAAAPKITHRPGHPVDEAFTTVFPSLDQPKP